MKKYPTKELLNFAQLKINSDTTYSDLLACKEWFDKRNEIIERDGADLRMKKNI